MKPFHFILIAFCLSSCYQSQKADLIKVEGKFITILDNDALAKTAAIIKPR